MTFTKTTSILTLLCLSLLWSCSGKKKENDFGIGKYRPNSLIRNHLLFSNFEEAYSFPIWFDDSIISAKKILSITRNVFPESADLSHLDSGRVVPAESFQYFFKKNGQIEKVIHSNFYDHKLIGTSTYVYGPTNHENGYASAKRTTKFTFNSLTEKSPKTNHPLFDKAQTSKDEKESYLTFPGLEKNGKLFIVPDSKLWGPFRIHQRLKPSPKDEIIIGSAYHPVKKYRVTNTVRENSVQLFTYEKGLIRQIEKKESIFEKKRSFQYGRRGHCISYIDSLFSENGFLTREVSTFKSNMDFNPVEIAHRKENFDGVEVFSYFETFEYDYRK